MNPASPNVASRKRRKLMWLTCVVAVAGALGGWLLWSPGLEVRDGRHDRGHNAIWLAHGWLGGDSWFIRYNKTNEFTKYRDPARVAALAELLKRHHIDTVFPHLCPTFPDGRLPEVDSPQVERFLDVMKGISVVPWVGGPNETAADVRAGPWRQTFCRSVRELLEKHPRLAGVQVNIEPMPDGHDGFLNLLEELRQVLPPGKCLSIAAYPPPTRWHPYPSVHWSEGYFRAVAQRSDELAVMMYDAALHSPRLYQKLMADWTGEVLAWSEGRRVLLGVPTYHDAGVGYHDPATENLTNALLGVHRGLAGLTIPTNYAGVAIYSEWETDATEWEYFRSHFLKP